MAKKRRQAKIPTPAWDRPRGSIGGRVFGRSSQFYGAVAIGALVVLALGIIGYAFLSDYVEDQRRPGSTALRVDDTRFKLDYFSRRLKMYVDQFGGLGSDAAQPVTALPAVTDQLIAEEVVRRFASEFDVTASEDEIRQSIAGRLGIATDDETFDLVFQQELARSGISEPDYRAMIEAGVLRGNLEERFLAEVPETAESVRYRQILVSTDQRAQEIKRELEGGGDFEALASENSLDVQTKDKGGEAGWIPRGVLDASTEQLVFAREVGEITTIPLPSGVLLIEMEEKADDRAIEEEIKAPLAARAFDSWVQEKRQSLTIVNNMDLSQGDIDKIDWAVSRAYQPASSSAPVPVQGDGG